MLFIVIFVVGGVMPPSHPILIFWDEQSGEGQASPTAP